MTKKNGIAADTVAQRRCPHCNKLVFKENTRLSGAVQGLGSIHAECPHCNKEVVCGYLCKTQEYVLISRTTFDQPNEQIRISEQQEMRWMSSWRE